MSEHSTKQKHKVLGTPKRGNVSGEASLRRKGSIGYRRMARRSQGRLKRRKRVLDLGVNACSVVQSLNDVQLFATPWTTARQASLSFPISQSLLRFVSIESVMPSNRLILSSPSALVFHAAHMLKKKKRQTPLSAQIHLPKEKEGQERGEGASLGQR